MEIIKLTAGVYAANCYLVYEGEKGFIVDPGGQADKIIKNVENCGFKPSFILLTHGHCDHIGAAQELRDYYDIPILVHEDDAKMLDDRELNLSTMLPSADAKFTADKTFKDTDVLYPGDFDIEVIHTPGHTAGSSCFKIGDFLISGDTLFAGNVGRTDLATSDPDAMIESLAKLKKLDDGIKVYPGHGEKTNLGHEKETNRFF